MTKHHQMMNFENNIQEKNESSSIQFTDTFLTKIGFCYGISPGVLCEISSLPILFCMILSIITLICIGLIDNQHAILIGFSLIGIVTVGSCYISISFCVTAGFLNSQWSAWASWLGFCWPISWLFGLYTGSQMCWNQIFSWCSSPSEEYSSMGV